MADFVLLTCEHGGNRVPAEYAPLFDGQCDLLESHRGYDPGALELARTCAKRLNAPLHFATVTRLLIELNRSIGHTALFSSITKPLPRAGRDVIRNEHYTPYRSRVEAVIEQAVRDGNRVVHLSMHTFTPELNGVVRRADIGVLYDPRRPGESRFADILKRSLGGSRQDLLIRKNYPYLGKGDGFTTSLRRRWRPFQYAGVEIEVNHRWHFGDPRDWRRMQRDLAKAMADSLAAFAKR